MQERSLRKLLAKAFCRLLGDAGGGLARLEAVGVGEELAEEVEIFRPGQAFGIELVLHRGGYW